MDNITVEDLKSIITNFMRKSHTLLDCPERFSGDYGGQKIQLFIEYIQNYKRIKCITDEQALEELEYLLIEHAYTWWTRRKYHFTTWSEALTALQNQYAKQRPAHVIYKDVFEHSYGEYTKDEDFISDKYELLSELPEPKLTEKNKIDIIFGLLPNEKQSKLEYAIISNLIEFKEQILKLKHSTSSTDATMICNGNNIECAETKDEINGHEETVHEKNHCDSVENGDIASKIVIINDKDPIIKVRRTEDLMPQLKEEVSGDVPLEHQEEFISTENITQENETTTFDIDTDIMNQINKIIDQSEMNENLPDNLQISSIMCVRENTPSTIAFLLNGETTIHTEESSKTHPAVRVTENKVNRKQKSRCNYCRKYGHKSQVCLKRAKHMKLFPDKFLPKIKPSEDSHKEIEEVVDANSNNKDVRMNNTNIDTVSSIQSLVSNNPPPLITTVNTSICHQAMPTSVTSTLSQNCILPSLPPTFNHTTLTSVPPAFSHATTSTTKLIAPINCTGLNKQLSAKLRNINGPSPKCHQCGTVGFYKSICPNCSPIYNSNHYK